LRERGPPFTIAISDSSRRPTTHKTIVWLLLDRVRIFKHFALGPRRMEELACPYENITKANCSLQQCL